ncbi:MAG TPA: non-homologous end-joining DNA ligase [Actinomycetes bacterium]|nr:non-homologous end-joining DNA ligase [Actinomycetes bacterium]
MSPRKPPAAPPDDDALATYRSKRDPGRTPEPVPGVGPLPRGDDDTFVIQEHHARRLHWDVRLERDGVLVSWAVPRGLPDDPKRNHLAVHTEDHPLEYAGFAGWIPKGEYGGGQVIIWDRGTYECEKWTDDEVKVVLHGERVEGRFVFFRTNGDDWMVHRMGTAVLPPQRTHPPRLVRPMLATPGELPSGPDDAWAFEMKWDGVRAVTYVDAGSVRVLTRNDREVRATYPELAGLGDVLGDHAVVLDGEIVALDEAGRPSFGVLQQRMHVQRPGRSLLETVPVVYLVFDLLWVDGRSLLDAPYADRRQALEALGLTGPHWQTPPAFPGDGQAASAASREQGLEGVLAKRVGSTYQPGRRSRDWVKVKHIRTQEVVVGGWLPGQGWRSDTIGALLLGVPDPDGRLVYAGRVGTGFTQSMLDDLLARLGRLAQKSSPYADALPAADARQARWVAPEIVGEVAFSEWTRDGRLRHPRWRGLRTDKAPKDVRRES